MLLYEESYRKERQRSMDELKIVSGFTKGILSKLVRMLLRKKIGYDIDIQLNDVKATIIEEKAKVHLDLDAELSKEELTKLLKKIGLN
jgi:hypothetical protein